MALPAATRSLRSHLASALLLGGLLGCDTDAVDRGRFDATVRGSGVEHVLSGPAVLSRVEGAPALRVTLRDDDSGRSLTLVLTEPRTGGVEIGPQADLSFASPGAAPLVGQSGSVDLAFASFERVEGTFAADLSTADGEPTVFRATGAFDAVRADGDDPSAAPASRP